MAQTNTEGDLIELNLTAWGRYGEALASLDGQSAFVFGGIPGETVIAEIVKQRRRYISAKVVKVINPSPHRISNPCKYFGSCTGCQWQHIEYDHQLEIKKEIVIDSLQRIGGFQNPPVMNTIPSPEHYEYRNHARFTVNPNGHLGFVNRETRKFVHIEHCMIMNSGINKMLASIQGKCSETTQLSIRYGADTGNFLIQPTLKNPLVTINSGQQYYMEWLNGRTFNIASPSFFQVNIKQLETLVDYIKNILNLSGSERIVDAYTGVGTFAILLAKYAGQIVAIEESSSAISDAEQNAEGVPGIQFIQGKTEEILSGLEVRPYAVILDPPRKGCQIEALMALNQLQPEKVVYVSCDPTTLGRDLKIMCDGLFNLETVQPIDMFPQTRHVECIAYLSRKPILLEQ